MNIKITGQSIFIAWDDLDSMADKWAKKVFGAHVHGETVRDEIDCYITIHGLKAEDYKWFKVFYEKYDRENDYDPQMEFEVGEKSSIFPGTVSLGIFNEELSERIGFRITKIIAIYTGVFFIEMDPFSGSEMSYLRHDGCGS